MRNGNIGAGDWMKKNIKRLAGMTIAIIILVLAVKIIPIVSSGYNLYKEATGEKNIEARIDQLKNYENYTSIDDISAGYIISTVESEDKNFYVHRGFDMFATMRAMYNNFRAGKIVEGGSTITQQLAKNLYFSFEKKYERKVAELIVALQLEKRYTKDEILEYYLNIVYFGEGCHGIREASLHYYGVEPGELNQAQTDALIRTLRSPNNYNPNQTAEEALK